MKLALAVGFLLVVTTVHAQDLPLRPEIQKTNDLMTSRPVGPLAQEEISPKTSIPDGMVSKVYAQPIPDKPQAVAREGQWIANGEPIPAFPDDLIVTERKEGGRLKWHVERVDSCTWCGKPMTWKQAAFDKKSTSLWALSIAMDVANIESLHHLPCFQDGNCKEGNPLLGQTRAQSYTVSTALIAQEWWGAAYLRKGSKTEHIGGNRDWYIIPVIGQALSAVGIIANLARCHNQ
jgi:hypothetical protein